MSQAASKALGSFAGAFGNILQVPDKAFGQAGVGEKDRQEIEMEEEMRQMQLIASQK